MRNESWYRRCAGWVAIVKPNDRGYLVVLRRTVRTFDDAFDIANEVIDPSDMSDRQRFLELGPAHISGYLNE